ncbi:Pleckstrin homology domain-containing protein [Emericellopsis atlantica]|uniref:Pleckstrin homology domain-containing protein n=1 Tax=Emericellopsis atlantica TaxID=2614577 RepID=A0A9P7ZQH9_9HYPO|nr:Pleckstrin homology domain-containing protein [Emericellopsis atlantica]KAG9255981.1 Pleckstrin homology domain-containing protein [Emericellopsis atlantica]
MAAAVQNTPEVNNLNTEETAPALTAAVETPKIEETPIPSTQPTEENKTAEEPKAEDKVADETKPAEETTDAKAEEKKEEVKPIEEGHLGHKAQGASFPKNLIGSKEFFFFGTDAVEPKALTGYQKNEKSTATYQSNVAWASETGKGLLFIGEKSAPTGIINLSDATEPETEGANKFTLTSKGNKHSFKAANAAERDNWVAQLKLKIAEAKELAATVTESATYKSTLESFTPKKEEKVADKPAEETPAVAADAAAPTTEEAKTEEAVKEPEAAKGEETVEKPEETKPQAKKRSSFFGFLDKKDKPVEKKEETPVAADEPAVAADKPAEEPKAEAPIATEPEAEAAKTSEEKPAESPKEKATKRNSFFGGILSKKEKKVAEPKPATEATEPAKDGETATTPAAETAPVIPPVEATTPLAVDVNNKETTAASPAEETAESPAAATEAKKDTKEKRKSSLPFLGKREKSPAPAEGETKSSTSAFSKLRATIKGKSGAAKTEDKPAEEAKKDEEAVAETKAEDDKAPVVPEPATVEPVKDEAAEPAETETKPENVATTTPAVTAAA